MSPPPVLVIRAQPGASQTASALCKLGFTPVTCPVLELADDPDIELPDLETMSGIVFTSANGVRFFAERSEDRSKTAWCVGPATASSARTAGFQDVRESAGNATDLAAFILANADPDERPLLHVANAAAKGDLQAHLQSAGRAVAFCPLYHARRVSRLGDEAAATLRSGSTHIILVHSAKGAEAFLGAATDWSPPDSVIVAISEAAAAPFRPHGVARISIAAEPNENALLEALCRLAQV